ncbi:hypothetical protein FEM48_Zijuj06G0165000 [Ziziphus jujuba var. spinosa]|uniref:DM2 domain-containing protein n=1 Tax=Ziziphus jujuba var. spinosa TaxID=714518 RepID=A0A978VAD4_ZIZJJ|nr:hypothetical protein FEM48_Zijuj06G0165000 [Ziziphus jujuba var. spinosa]
MMAMKTLAKVLAWEERDLLLGSPSPRSGVYSPGGRGTSRVLEEELGLFLENPMSALIGILGKDRIVEGANEEEEETEVQGGDGIKCVRKRTQGFNGGSKGSLNFCSSKGSPTLLSIMMMVPVSPVHSNFLETSEASHSHAVKKVWEYVKLHNL